jgi:undecaprenyl phosphate-alpha-L-ara4N flippase subunit ArnE
MSPGIILSATIAFCIATETARELCFKYAAMRDGRNFLLVPATWLGVAFWGVELLAWIVVLAETPLSVAFPLMALSYVTIAIAAAILFKEKLNHRRLLGIALIVGGVVCVGASGL